MSLLAALVLSTATAVAPPPISKADVRKKQAAAA